MCTLERNLFSLGSHCCTIVGVRIGQFLQILVCDASASAYGHCFGVKLYAVCMRLFMFHDGLFGRQTYARRHKGAGEMTKIYWYADKA